MALQIIDTTTDHGTYKGDPAKVAFEKANGNFAESFAGRLTHISGMTMDYVSGSSVQIGSGSAYIPGPDRIVDFPSAITKSGISLGNNAWGHVYAFVNGSNPDFEVSTTAPSSPYRGSARTKTGDSSRRYVGSVRTDASGNIINFRHSNTEVFYRANILVAPFVVLSGGSASTGASVSCAALVPVSSRVVLLMATNSDASVRLDLWNSEGAQSMAFVNGANSSQLRVALNASQAFLYAFASAPSGSANIRVTGYAYER